MQPRRPRVRTVRVPCPQCGSRVTWDITPRAYVQHVWRRPLTDAAWHGRCVCGAPLAVSVGEAMRAAA
jgi:hypothetical protein